MAFQSTRLVAFALCMTFPLSLLAISHEKADSLHALLKKNPSDKEIVAIQLELSKIYFLEDYKRSLDYARSAIGLAEKAGLDVELKEAIRLAGKTCFHAGLMEMASQYFNRHLSLVGKKGSKLDVGGAYINLGAVRLFLEDYEAAKNYNVKALKMLEEYAKERGDAQLPPNVLPIYNNLGIILREQKKFKEALYYLKKGKEMARGNPDYSANLVKLLNNEAILFMTQGKIDNAGSNLEESLKISVATADKPSESATCLNIGKLFRKKRNYPKALEFCKSAYRIAEEVNGIDLSYNATDELYRIYEETGPADSTLKYLTLSRDLLKQINVAKAREDMARQELEKYYREKEIAEMQKEKNAKLLQFMLLAMALMASAGVFLFYLRTKKALNKSMDEKAHQDHAIEALASERDQLSEQLEKKERQLAVEALHRFKNKEILEDVTGKLLEHVKSSKEESEYLIKKVLRDLQKTQDRTGSLRNFEIAFLNVQKDFFEKLNKINPHLSPNERRLCAFLRLDMSSKDISALTGQSVNSVNVARIRLRKKLGLTNSSVSLVGFLASL